MKKKRFNWKSRTVANVEIDNSTTREIGIDIEHRADKYNSSNAFVLPAKKRKTKNIDKTVKTTRLLSKKRRKQLEQVVERKKKKKQTAQLLEELAKVQVPATELQQYISLTSLQNKGLKRHFRELEAPEPKLKHKANEEQKGDTTQMPTVRRKIWNSIKGSNKKKRLALLDNVKQKETISDPNVVGFETSGESDDSECNTDNEDEGKVDVCDSVPTSDIATSEKNDKDNITKDGENKTFSKKTQESEKNDNNSRKKGEDETKAEKCKISEANVQQSVTSPVIRTPAVFVSLDRKPEIQDARLKLPIVAEEQVIIEKINENPIVIITGETGSGKTTQVPQFLYEAGYAQNKLIGITEPRRVAAMSMSKRVAEEMNLTEKEVSYLIRFEGNVTKDTKIKFMTDGILLKEIQRDFLLTKYSVIILDEAHERTVYTDVLVGMLSRIVPLRTKRNNPLKLIIMSATLRVEEFVENAKLFKEEKPPVITIETRQFPVTIHFNKRTSEDYVNDALRKTIKIHTRLPDGGILVFLTGQQEIHTVVRELRKAFPLKNDKHRRVKQAKYKNKITLRETVDEQHSEKDSDDDFDLKEALRRNKRRRKKQMMKLPIINLDNYSVIPTDDMHEDLIDDEDNLDEDEDEDVMDFNGLTNAQPMWVLPLYSLLPGHEQAKVFKPPPEGYRLCVVCTNVAETSLTIPNIKYVVDSGRCKTKVYDKITGVSTYRICYVSKAAASQRAGRAGRTGPGHCYRLYSSAVYNNQFEEYNQPEIQRRPVDDLVLQLKSMNITKVVNFPLPTPPDIAQLKSAERRLTILGALEQVPLSPEETYSASITSLGRSMAAFPVAPCFSKMLTLSYQHNLWRFTICIVASLSVREVLVDAFGTDELANSKWLQIRRYWADTGNSLLLGDVMVLLTAVGAAEYEGSTEKILSFCEENGLRYKALMEIRKLRQQLTNEINLIMPDQNLTVDPKMLPPTEMEAKLLRQIVLAGMVNQIARKVAPDEVKFQDMFQWKYAYRTPEMEDPIFMHSSSVLRQTCPEWVVYQELYETNKIYMRGVTAIEPEWLPKFASALCRLSEPMTDPPPRYDKTTGKVMCRVTGTFGRAAWKLPPVDIEYPSTVEGVKWFVCFLLDGQVCPKLKRFVPSLLNTPASVTKTWAKLVPRIQAIMQEMLFHGIMTKEKLQETWAADKYFLLSAYQKWLPVSMHAEVMRIWPPL